MKTYSSTRLKLLTANCGYALQLDEDGEPYNMEYFHTGVAAHAVLEQFAIKNPPDYGKIEIVADETVRVLITEGRTHNGVWEAPMNPKSALDGRDLAISWWTYRDVPEHGSILSVESGLGMDSKSEPCHYDSKKCRYRAITDIIYERITGDEDYSFKTLVIRDWKSAWPAGEDELDTLQRRGQAVLGYLNYCQSNPTYQAITLEVANLRTGVVHSRDIMLDDEGVEIIAGWAKDILLICDTADSNRHRRFGTNCVGCRYIAKCLAENKSHPFELKFIDSPESAAMYFSVQDGMRQEAFKLAMQSITEGNVNSGAGVVGFYGQDFTVVTHEGARIMLERWLDITGETATPGMYSFIEAIKPTATNLTSYLKALYQGRGSKPAREEMAAEVSVKVTKPRFGIWDKP